MAANETNDSKEVVNKLKELEASLAKELDQKIRLSEPTDPRLEGTVDVNPSMAMAVKKAKDQAMALTLEEQKAADMAARVAKAAAAGAAGTASASAAANAANAATASTAAANAAAAAASQANQMAQGNPANLDSAQTSSTDVENMTVKDVDELLSQLDEGFQASMEEIKNEIAKVEAIPVLESLSIGAEYLKEAESKDKTVIEEDVEATMTSDDLGDLVESDRALAKYVPFTRVFVRFILASALLPWHVAVLLVKQLKGIKSQPPKELILGLLPLLGAEARQWMEALRALVQKLMGYPRHVYIKASVIFVLALAIFLLVRDVAVNFRSDRPADPFLTSFAGVADSVQAIPDEDEGEDLESPLRHPEYTVLVHRMVANLKAPSPNRSPMVVLELYIEASNQEAAIEIHNREAEVHDIIQRILEQTTFDEIDSGPGKTRLKIRIRNGLNRILNRGTARHIYFKNLNFAE